MSKQTQKKTTKAKSSDGERVVDSATPQADHTKTDDILAAIDEVVEEMGEEFALNFRQKGGE